MFEASFYTNQSEPNFLNRIIQCLDRCVSFSWSVSFIKKAGLILLLPHLEKALSRGAKGKILTSTYQNFTDIASLETFLELQRRYPNFECRLENHSFDDDGFHTKGYLFEYEDSSFESIVGSSNITRFALLKNKEWDVGISSSKEYQFVRKILEEFNYLWNKVKPLTRENVKEYEIALSYAIVSWDMDYSYDKENGTLKPNFMQRQALKELQNTRNRNINKAMVIAATGSGKTYLAAFDANFFGAKRLLFIVHKDTILTQALNTFSKVFGQERSYGLFNGKYSEIDKDFIFASNQMLSKHLELFSPEEFDYIIIDEVHHAAASTYQKIIEYFKPSFLLGLTATPDRMDGEDVYQMFGNNVPFDLRLRDALENHLIVPFHYYGIKDDLISYQSDGSVEGNRLLIQSISSSLHCSFVRDEIEKHRPEGKLRCIGFCRNVEHAKEMAMQMMNLGYSTAYLTGSSSLGERIRIFQRLEDKNDPLELVFAVDILNEGIDVPSINMVLFLRPTESSTIFIQQLGRGLRKYENKQYLIVLDFIANSYLRSVQIALALGSLSKSGVSDKLALANMVRDNFSSLAIPNLEIHFEEKAQEEILQSIEKTNFNSIAFLKADYQNLKSYLKLGPNEYPKHEVFLDQETGVDILHFTKKFPSYYDFLERMGEDVPFFSKEERECIETIYEYLPLVHPEEYLIIKELLNGKKTEEELYSSLKDVDHFKEDTFSYALRVLQDEFYYTRPSYHHTLVKKEGDYYSLNFEVSKDSFKDWLISLLEYGLTRYQIEFYNVEVRLKRYHPYTSFSSLLALNSENLFRMMGVFKVDKERVIYIDLKKDEQVLSHLKYKDRFLSPSLLQWESQTGTRMNNSKGISLLKDPYSYIFVRKAKREDGAEMPFYYLGRGYLKNPRVSDNPKETLLFDIELEEKVPLMYYDDFGIEKDEEENSGRVCPHQEK